MNIDEQILNAFQVEHREHLARIRALLAEHEEQPGDRAGQLDEAFRLAHSLKGGARVCNLRQAETLGHGLETVFSQLREGRFQLDDEMRRGINVVLDGIEDWMVALVETETPPEPVDALCALERLLQDGPAVDSPHDLEQLAQRELLAAFQCEHLDYVEGLRAFLQSCRAAGDLQPKQLEEAFVLAHDLWGSARAVGLDALAAPARQLEAVIRQLRDGVLELDSQALRAVEAALADIDREVSALAKIGRPGDTAVLGEQAAGATPHRGETVSSRSAGRAQRPRRPVTNERELETVRIRAQSLDRLLQSSGQLLTESLCQDQVTRELGEWVRNIERLDRERESIRRAAGAGFQKLLDHPELRRLAHDLEGFEKQVCALTKTARQIYLRQQRSCWQLRACGNGIQQDMRQARMVSAGSLFQGFAKMVRDLARCEGKAVDFQFVGADVRADRIVLDALKDPVMHILRNAVIHGIERPDERRARGKPDTGRVCLTLYSSGNQLQIVVEDDGRGVDWRRVAELARQPGADPAQPEPSAEELARLLFQPGFSTCSTVSELAGRGMGLSVVYEAARRLQGDVQLRPATHAGTAIAVSVPLLICTQRLLLVAGGDQLYAIPLRAIERLLRVRVDELQLLKGTPVVIHRERPIPLLSLAGLLGAGTGEPARAGSLVPVVILKAGARRVALGVEAFVAERDALVHPLDEFAAREVLAGAVLMEDGTPILVLNPLPLAEGELPTPEAASAAPLPGACERGAPRVLVVDDSFTTRTLEKSILETHGYEVHTATDGVEALAQMGGADFDAVICDIEMPNLNGFELLEEMKKRPRLSHIPCILVTSRDRQQDQQRGMELGADAYIVKRKFDHEQLLDTIRQLL